MLKKLHKILSIPSVLLSRVLLLLQPCCALSQLLPILLVFLIASCGSGGRVEVIQDGTGSYLIMDRFCTTRIKASSLRRSINGTRRLEIRESDVHCRMLNVSKSQYLSDTFQLEEVFEEGERIWIIGDESMDYIIEHMIENNLIERDNGEE